ncbi:MAG: serine protease [bacterium]|nr:serine protease [bacterium]
MASKILTFVLVFCLGAAGGIWSQAFLLPAMAANPALQNWQFIKDWSARVQVVAPVHEIFVRENQAIEQVVQRAKGTVVGIESGIGRRGSGLVYTSDGLIVTTSYLVPQGYRVTVYPENQEPLSAQVLKRDVTANLALLKVEETGLQTSGFVANGGVALGARVVLIAKLIDGEDVSLFMNQGLIKQIQEDRMITSITERTGVDGAPLFDVEGRVAGLADSDFQGNIFAIPSSVLRSFLGL